MGGWLTLQHTATHRNTLQSTATQNCLNITQTDEYGRITHTILRASLAQCSDWSVALQAQVCCSVMQRVAVCCSVLQRVAVWCNALQCFAEWLTQYCEQVKGSVPTGLLQRVAACCGVLQCDAACCNVLQSVTECCRVLQSVAECCRAGVSLLDSAS